VNTVPPKKRKNISEAKSNPTEITPNTKTAHSNPLRFLRYLLLKTPALTIFGRLTMLMLPPKTDPSPCFAFIEGSVLWPGFYRPQWLALLSC
jgi:hypothetical protein